MHTYRALLQLQPVHVQYANPSSSLYFSFLKRSVIISFSKTERRIKFREFLFLVSNADEIMAGAFFFFVPASITPCQWFWQYRRSGALHDVPCHVAICRGARQAIGRGAASRQRTNHSAQHAETFDQGAFAATCKVGNRWYCSATATC